MKIQYDLDELRLVLNSLRHDCNDTNSVSKAIKTISNKTKIPRDKVKKILFTLAKDGK